MQWKQQYRSNPAGNNSRGSKRRTHMLFRRHKSTPAEAAWQQIPQEAEEAAKAATQHHSIKNLMSKAPCYTHHPHKHKPSIAVGKTTAVRPIRGVLSCQYQLLPQQNVRRPATTAQFPLFPPYSAVTLSKLLTRKGTLLPWGAAKGRL
jgi:hypothetical protein